MIKKIQVLAIILVLIFIASCSKKDDKTPAKIKKSETTSSILNKIPQNSFAYFIINADTANYQKYLSSPYSFDVNKLSDKFNDAKGTNFPKLDVTKTQELIKILFPNKEGTSKTKTILGFSAGDSVQTIEAGLVFVSTDKSYYSNNFSKITELLKNENLETVKTEKNLLILKEKTSNIFLHIKNDNDTLVVSNSENSLNRIFAKINKDQEFNPNKEEISRLRNKINFNNELSAIYIDFKKAFTLFPVIGLVPDNFKPLLNLIPQNIYTSQKFDDVFTRKGVFYLPTDTLPNELKNIFTKSQDGSISNLSQDSIAAFSLNMNLINGVISYIKNNNLIPEFKLDTLFRENSNLLLALSSNGMSPLPDLQIVLPAKDADKTLADLKSLASNQASKYGAQLPQWNSKVINEVQTDYILTPFGVGVYFAKNSSNLYITTSELAMKSILSEGKLGEKLKSYDAKLNSDLFLSYINYPKIYELAISIQGMVSMFTGGQNGEYLSQIESLKTMGQELTTSKYEDNILSFETNYKIASTNQQ